MDLIGITISVFNDARVMIDGNEVHCFKHSGAFNRFSLVQKERIIAIAQRYPNADNIRVVCGNEAFVLIGTKLFRSHPSTGYVRPVTTKSFA